MAFAPPFQRPFSATFDRHTAAVVLAPVSGMVAWWKADALALSNNDYVATWTSSAGTNTLTSPNDTVRPLYKTNVVNGKPVVRFDGSNDYMISSAQVMPTGAYDYSIFLVHSAVGTSLDVNGRSWMWLYDTGVGVNGHFHLLYRNNITNYARSVFNGVGTPKIVYPSAAFGFDAFHISAVISTGYWYLDAVSQGTPVATVKETFTANNRVGLGWYYNQPPSNYFLSGDIAELIVYPSALSNADRQTTENYLKAKYAL